MKPICLIIALVAMSIVVSLVIKKEPVFTGKEYNGEFINANLFENPVIFTDLDGNLVDGYAVRYYPGTEQLYSKASFKDGTMHGPFLSFWDNGQVQMSMVWENGTHYKKMSSWDRNGKRLKGSADDQIKQIRNMDKDLGEKMDELEKTKLELSIY